MKNSQAWREEILAATAKIDAIVAVATEEKRELLPDEQAVVDELQGTADKPGTLADLQANYDRQIKIEARITSAIQTQRPEFVFASDADERIFRVPARAKRETFNRKAFTCVEDAYATGQWIMATIGGKERPRQWCLDNGVMAAHSEGDNTKGGYLVPEFWESSLIRVVESFGVFRQEARVVPMSSDVLNIPRRTGGFTVYYVGENTAIPTSDMAFGQVRLTAKKPAILTQVSSELNEDSAIAMAGLLTEEFGYALAVAEDQAGFLGNGTSTYGGIIGVINALAAGSIATATTGDTAFSTLDLDDFHAAKALLPAYVGMQPKWYISSQGFADSMERLAAAAGGNTFATMAGGLTPMFLGSPVRFVQSLPTTSAAQVSTIVALYGDLRLAATMGTRRGMTVKTDESFYFNQDALAVRCTERYDIVVHEVGTATVAGPLVALKTAAS